MLFIKAALSGFLVSAPVGAGTVLLARLAMGHHFGNVIALALGITVADTIIAALASLGLKVLEHYLPLNNPFLHSTMGLILLGFAAYLWCTPPSIVKGAPKMSAAAHFFTGFSLTTLNPFVLTGFVALFAALDLTFDVTPLMHLYLLIALFLGCVLWWYILTLLIFLLTKNRGNQALDVINKGLAGVMAILGLYALIRGGLAF